MFWKTIRLEITYFLIDKTHPLGKYISISMIIKNWNIDYVNDEDCMKYVQFVTATSIYTQYDIFSATAITFIYYALHVIEKLMKERWLFHTNLNH